MKRYNIEKDRQGFRLFNLFEDPDGEWVKYEDVKLYADGFGFGSRFIESIECNCLKEAEEAKAARNQGIGWPDAWICPAHGYKRL